MSKWRRLQQRQRQRTDWSFDGGMSESHLCIDCGFDTAPGNLNRAEAEEEIARQIAAGEKRLEFLATANERSEMFFVHDHVWRAAGMTDWSGCLCVGCLEKRIGRRLTPDDFSNHVFNTSFPGTPRLLERQGRHYDPLGEWRAA
jgi:hypothetical protein